jgi:tyrosyl-tRNA synthetase
MLIGQVERAKPNENGFQNGLNVYWRRDMWQYIVTVFLFLGAVYWIIRPLLHPEQLQDDFAPALSERIDQLTHQKEATYATIKELEFDFSMGKLSEEDFEALKKQYTLDALKYMEEIDQLQGSKSGKTRRPDKRFKDDTKKDQSTPLETGSTLKTGIFCTQCGKKADPRDAFCSNCGYELKKD